MLKKITRQNAELPIIGLIATAISLVGGVETGSGDFGKGALMGLVCVISALFLTK